MESATYWQQLFTQALRITQRWRAEHTRSEGVLAAAAEFQSRLHLLSRTGPGAGAGAGAPCVLAQLPDALALLRGKHLRGLENIMAALRESVAVFAALHAELAALHVRQPNPSPSPSPNPKANRRVPEQTNPRRLGCSQPCTRGSLAALHVRLPRARTRRPHTTARAPRPRAHRSHPHLVRVRVRASNPNPNPNPNHLRCRWARGGSTPVRQPTRRPRSQWLAPVAVRWVMVGVRVRARVRVRAAAGAGAGAAAGAGAGVHPDPNQVRSSSRCS